MRLDRIANRVLLAWGFRRALVAFGAGALSVLALPPFDLWPILFVTFPVVVWLVDGAAAGRFLGGAVAAGVAGWFFGFGYFLAGLYWVGFAFLVDAKTFGWLMPFAVIALPAGMAVYTGLGFALARACWRPGASRVLILAAALTLTEWVRGHAFSGFPWNAFGHALAGWQPLAQTAALVGLWGLTFIAVAVFASPAVLADDRRDTPRPALAPIAAMVALAAMAVFGAVRLQQTPPQSVDGVRLRIMQPNLAQDEKFNYAARSQVVARYLALSGRRPEQAAGGSPTHLIWPESAFPFFLTREPEALAQIAEFLPEGTVLITGAARAADTSQRGGPLRAYNSVYAIDHDGSILSVYDKMHLVPFGEYLPFQSLLERVGLQQLTKMQGGFQTGTRRRPMLTPGAPAFIPLICYEIIFPSEAVPPGERAGWMLNVTNDGWFGISSGPYQHFQQARLRAIEEGLPVVRAANTGISAVIDPLGRTLASLPLGMEGVLDATLPKPLAPTLYAKWRDLPVGALVVGTLTFALMRRRPRNRG